MVGWIKNKKKILMDGGWIEKMKIDGWLDG